MYAAAVADAADAASDGGCCFPLSSAYEKIFSEY